MRIIDADKLIGLIDDDIASLKKNMSREGYDVCFCTLQMVKQYIKALQRSATNTEQFENCSTKHGRRKGAGMSDLISRQAAIKAIEDLQDCHNGFSDTYDKACIIGVIEEVPPIEPIKHGRWKWNKQYGTECSECGTAMFEVIGHIFSSATPKYCPYCGARMDAQIGEDKSHPFAESVMMGMDGGENGRDND